MSHETPTVAYLTLRMPRSLADDLRSAAARESNTQSAVARRLISTGLARERATIVQDERETERTA